MNLIRNKYHMIILFFYGFLFNILSVVAFACIVSFIKNDAMLILLVLGVVIVLFILCIIFLCFLSQWCQVLDDKLCFRNNFIIHKEVYVQDIKGIEFVDIKKRNNRLHAAMPVIVIKLTNKKISNYKYIMGKNHDHYCIDLNQSNYSMLKDFFEKNGSYLLDMISTGEYGRFNIEK